VTLGGIVGIDMVLAYLVEPIWIGRRVKVSPVALLVSAMLWTWLWGPIGLILSTPIAISLQVIGETVPSLGFLDVMLGDGSPLDVHLRYFARLVARDAPGAVELADHVAAERGLEPLFDEVIAPALAELARARSERRIDEETARAAGEIARGSVEGAEGACPPGRRSLRTLVTAPSLADELAALMAVRVLHARGHEAERAAPDASPADLAAQVARTGAQALVLVVSSAECVPATLAFVERVRAAHPRLGLVAIGPPVVEEAKEFLRRGCLVGRHLATLRHLLPRAAERRGLPGRGRRRRARRAGADAGRTPPPQAQAGRRPPREPQPPAPGDE
jgi:hypothetical protein